MSKQPAVFQISCSLNGMIQANLLSNAQVKEMSVSFIFLSQIEYAAKAPPTRVDLNMTSYVLDYTVPSLEFQNKSGETMWHPENREKTIALNPALSKQFDSFKWEATLSLLDEGKGNFFPLTILKVKRDFNYQYTLLLCVNFTVV